MGVIAKKCSIAIVKVGASGSYIRKGTEEIKVSAIPVQKVVDTPGCFVIPVYAGFFQIMSVWRIYEDQIYKNAGLWE